MMEGAEDCPRCGDDISDDDRFCSSCGLDLATYRNLWPESISEAASEARAPLSSAGPTALATPTSPTAETPRVPTYLGWAAVLVTLCWPAFWAGVPAVVHAGRAESLLAAGDLAGAQAAAAKAKTWCWVTFWSGVLLWTVALILVATL